MDRRPCMCFPFGTSKAGAGGTEAGQVGALEAGLSGFETGRCVLRRQSAVNDSSVAWPAALFCRPSPRQSCDVSKTINIITYEDVWHDGGVGVLSDCMREWGWRKGRGGWSIQLHVRYRTQRQEYDIKPPFWIIGVVSLILLYLALILRQIAKFPSATFPWYSPDKQTDTRSNRRGSFSRGYAN